jgi:hypothetical protein
MYSSQAPAVCPSTKSVNTRVSRLPKGRVLISNLLYTEGETDACFSIAVSLFRDGKAEDMRLVEDFTRDQKTAHALFDRITDGTVTPCTLCDVLEDLLE